MKQFKSYITEIAKEIKIPIGKEESTFMEQVIISSWNSYNKARSFPKFKEELLKDGKIVFFIKHHKKIKFSNDLDEGTKELWLFAKNLHKKAGFKGVAESAGRASPEMSVFWQEQKGKTKDTSKTDILIGAKGKGKQISVKNGKAQLMSGGKDETRATVLAAMKGSGLKRSLGGQILDAVEAFAGSTETEGLTTTELRNTPVKDLVGVKNKKAKKVLAASDKVKQQIVNILDEAFRTQKFRNSFAFEAMTGWEKFGGKTFGKPGDDIGRADVFLIFSDDLQNVRIENIDSPAAKEVSLTAKKMKIDSTMKSSSKKVKGVKTGYRFFQTLRLEVQTVFDKTTKLKEDYENTQEELDTYLVENSNQEYKNIPLNEIEIIKKLGDKLVAIKNKIIDVFKKLSSIIKDGVQKIKEAIAAGMETVWSVLEMEPVVSVNRTVNLI